MDTVRIDPPLAREPRPVTAERALTGKRLIVRMEDPETGITQDVRDYRAAGEVFTEAGTDYVRIVPELNWYAWQTDPAPDKPPACPRARAWPAEFCWVE